LLTPLYCSTPFENFISSLLFQFCTKILRLLFSYLMIGQMWTASDAKRACLFSFVFLRHGPSLPPLRSLLLDPPLRWFQVSKCNPPRGRRSGPPAEWTSSSLIGFFPPDASTLVSLSSSLPCIFALSITTEHSHVAPCCPLWGLSPYPFLILVLFLLDLIPCHRFREK